MASAVFCGYFEKQIPRYARDDRGGEHEIPRFARDDRGYGLGTTGVWARDDRG
jgi:hypothetical protein